MTTPSATPAPTSTANARAVAPPPEVGTCLRLDEEKENLADDVDCKSDQPHYRVTWSGETEDAPPHSECQFYYYYAFNKVCLFPEFTVGKCYSAAAETESLERLQPAETVRYLNSGIEPIPCDGPPHNPDEFVAQMVGEVPGLDGLNCPFESGYVVSDPTTNVSSCVVRVGG